MLANHVWSQPDQAQIAIQVSSWSTYILLLLLTFGGAVWVARTVEIEPLLHGVLMGLVVGFVLCFLSYGLWESCYDGTGHPGPDYGSWLPRWPPGQPGTVEAGDTLGVFDAFLRLRFVFVPSALSKTLLLRGETCSGKGLRWETRYLRCGPGWQERRLRMGLGEVCEGS